MEGSGKKRRKRRRLQFEINISEKRFWSKELSFLKERSYVDMI